MPAGAGFRCALSALIQVRESNRGRSLNMAKQKHFNWTFWIIAAMMWLALQLWLGHRSVLSLEYSEFLSYLEKGQVAEVTVTETRNVCRFKA